MVRAELVAGNKDDAARLIERLETKYVCVSSPFVLTLDRSLWQLKTG